MLAALLRSLDVAVVEHLEDIAREQTLHLRRTLRAITPDGLHEVQNEADVGGKELLAVLAGDEHVANVTVPVSGRVEEEGVRVAIYVLACDSECGEEKCIRDIAGSHQLASIRVGKVVAALVVAISQLRWAGLAALLELLLGDVGRSVLQKRRAQLDDEEGDANPLGKRTDRACGEDLVV